ncbi:MAG: BlaI/MecI/CopY family transcriptional regulator [Oscillibacter sp.]|jgi:BlaI family penicillinase repressor|nr:BlaI/MecI/CopY family transcriptional regulator [Oscillibacter sp.]
MEEHAVTLTAAEWNVMECLWERSPRTAMELVAALRTRTGWAKSTTMTMLARMEKKGLIACGQAEKPRSYTPCVPRDEAVRRETESFVERVYHGSVGLMMSSLVEGQELSPRELQELYAILKKAEEGRK